MALAALAGYPLLSCRAQAPADSGSTEASSTDGGVATSTEPASSTDTSHETIGETSAEDTAANWPDCLPPSIPDIAVAMTVEPDNGYSARAYSGDCTIAQISDVIDGALSIDLTCSGGNGPAPEWEVGIAVAGIGDTVPAALVENAQVELALYVERLHLPVTAFSLAVRGAVNFAGLDGTYVDIELATGSSHGLWPGARITSATEQRCAQQEPLAVCGPPVSRNLLSFIDFDQKLDVFDHQSAQTGEFEMRVGDALVMVDDGEPWDCDGGPIERYQFLILRKD